MYEFLKKVYSTFSLYPTTDPTEAEDVWDEVQSNSSTMADFAVKSVVSKPNLATARPPVPPPLSINPSFRCKVAVESLCLVANGVSPAAYVDRSGGTLACLIAVVVVVFAVPVAVAPAVKEDSEEEEEDADAKLAFESVGLTVYGV